MELKVGDKLKSKLDLHCFLIKNEYYEISYIFNSIIIIKTDIQNINFETEIKFSQASPSDIVDVHMYIWDYFYTEKELRKLKLERLNEL